MPPLLIRIRRERGKGTPACIRKLSVRPSLPLRLEPHARRRESLGRSLARSPCGFWPLNQPFHSTCEASAPSVAKSLSPITNCSGNVAAREGFRVSRQVQDYLCGILRLKATGKSCMCTVLAVHLKYTTCACGLSAYTDRTPLARFFGAPMLIQFSPQCSRRRRRRTRRRTVCGN